MSPRESKYSAMHSGFGRVLTAVYGVFALSATARAGYQICRQFGEAPFAYSMSLFAAVVYIIATVCLVVGSKPTHRLAFIACSIELAGVIVIGCLSLIDPALFPDSTVWSGFGVGYGCVPLILPAVGLWWLSRVGRRADSEDSGR